MPPPPSTSHTWSWTDLGEGIGASGIHPLATTHGPRLVATTQEGGSWSVFRDDGGQGLTAVHSGRYDDQRSIAALTVGNVRPSSGDEIVVAYDDGVVDIFSGEDFELVDTMTLYETDISQLLAVDLTGEGIDEVLTVSRSLDYLGDLVVYDAFGSELSRYANMGGRDVVVGQMDGDDALEIATSSGFVIDAVSGQVEWNFGDSFGPMLELTDYDSDGMEELIVSQSWGYIDAYDVDTQLPAWTLEFSGIGRILVADVNGDGTEELIVGEGQWGEVLGFRLDTRTEVWALDNPEYDVNGLTVADLDEDGTVEIYWAAGFLSSGIDQLYRGDWASETLTWASVDLDGPFHGPALGDLNGDGALELVIVSNESDSGYGSARILAFDAVTKELLTISPETMEGAVGMVWVNPCWPMSTTTAGTR